MSIFKHDNHKSAIDDGEVSTSRLETLTDGIFAIAMTILVLDIHVPEIAGNVNSPQSLFFQLSLMWPRLISFAVSFIILGMFWVAHHTEFRYIKKLDNKLIWLNMFYLLLISFLPFSAALLGRYTHNQAAVIVYGVQLTLMVLLHYFIWNHATEHKNLVEANLDPKIIKLPNRLTAVALAAYVAAIVLSFWRVDAALIIYGITPLPYIFGWIYHLV